MQRWQEEWERKQAEFMRCIRSYDKMSNVWAELSKASPSQGHAAYTCKKSAMFSRMKQIAQAKFNAAGYANRALQDGQILSDLIQQDRQMDRQGLEDFLLYRSSHYPLLLDRWRKPPVKGNHLHPLCVSAIWELWASLIPPHPQNWIMFKSYHGRFINLANLNQDILIFNLDSLSTLSELPLNHSLLRLNHGLWIKIDR